MLDPDPVAPAAQVANRHLAAAYDDPVALAKLADICDVVTYEFENVPEAAVAALDGRVPVRPSARALAISQDRLVEKQFFRDEAIAPTASFAAIDSQAELEAAVAELGGRAIIKTRRFGYDGKGQLRIDGAVPSDAFESLGSVPLIAEGIIEFVSETSIIIAREANGNCAWFDPGVNEHVDGILRSVAVPGGFTDETLQAAIEAALSLTAMLDYVGVLGLELFVLVDGSIVANEFAPRVHNSGHWTEAACAVSQFEQHVRAVTGLPLVLQQRHSDAVMTNLIGDDVDQVDRYFREPNTMVHLYGKAEIRPGRKMGHVTALFPRTDRAEPTGPVA